MLSEVLSEVLSLCPHQDLHPWPATTKGRHGCPGLGPANPLCIFILGSDLLLPLKGEGRQSHRREEGRCVLCGSLGPVSCWWVGSTISSLLWSPSPAEMQCKTSFFLSSMARGAWWCLVWPLLALPTPLHSIRHCCVTPATDSVPAAVVLAGWVGPDGPAGAISLVCSLTSTFWSVRFCSWCRPSEPRVSFLETVLDLESTPVALALWWSCLTPRLLEPSCLWSLGRSSLCSW